MKYVINHYYSNELLRRANKYKEFTNASPKSRHKLHLNLFKKFNFNCSRSVGIQ